MKLEVRNLSRTYSTGGLFSGKQIRAVRNVSFTVEPGSSVGLVGESGSGKSTLARCIMRLEDPDDGTVRLGEHDLTAMSETPAKATAYAHADGFFRIPEVR